MFTNSESSSLDPFECVSAKLAAYETERSSIVAGIELAIAIESASSVAVEAGAFRLSWS